MSRLKMVVIDGDKLRNLITTTGTTLADASEQLGYARKFLNDCCKNNRISAQAASLIGLMLNIPQALYEIPQEEPEAKEPEPEATDVEGILLLILKEIKELKEIVKEENYEQKSWALPFSDPVACSDHDHDSCNI